MSAQPEISFRYIVLATLLFLTIGGCALTSAQTVNDSNQDQTYGIWKVPNPQNPGIQFRAKCDQDITDAQGRTKSVWNFQFRSTYKATTDFIYLNEAGIVQPPTNKMIGPFLDTLKPGEIYENGSELYGGCSQHATVTTGIHVTIKCAVPTGQDAPCFKDANGNPYPKAQQNDAQSGPTQAASTAKLPVRNLACLIGPKGTKSLSAFITQPFTSQQRDGDLEAKYKKWLILQHPEVGDTNWGEPLCFDETTGDIQTAMNRYIKLYKEQGVAITMVNWSPQ